MSDLPNRDIPGAQIDLSRLGQPHADAFRHIADALGARYAGDEEAAVVQPGGAPRPLHGLSGDAAPPHDPRAAGLLETLPLPVLVARADRVAYLNRRARTVLGYASAAMLEASGGLAALFGERTAADGAMAIADANGKVFRATVEMTPIDWVDGRAVMVSMQPLPAPETAPVPPQGAVEALSGLMDANPDPIAVITRGGRVEAANAAFGALAGGTSEDLRLEMRFSAGVLAAVLGLTAEAFASAEGAAALEEPVRIGAQAMTVSAGILRGSGLACLVFHPAAAPAEAPPATAADPAGRQHALERATATAGALIEDSAVGIGVTGGPVQGLERALAEETERFFRALLVAIGGRAPAGSTIEVARVGAHYRVSLAPAGEDTLAAVAASARLILFALEAGLALAPTDDGALSIAPLLSAPVAEPA